ncbi:calpain-5-like isoform X1 [Lampetra fluviatilis]
MDDEHDGCGASDPLQRRRRWRWRWCLANMHAKPFRGQCYSKLRRECLSAGRPFEDPLFPASDSSLYHTKPPPAHVEWRRPTELCTFPRMVIGGISAHDLNQGTLGNCWFVAACSCLATRPSVWSKVIPDPFSQCWGSGGPNPHPGIFHFCFWRFGQWLDVVVDDRLPTSDGKLLYCSSSEPSEFWSALLEKAYAKLCGSYEAMDGGSTAAALVDLSGGVSEPLDLTDTALARDAIRKFHLFSRLLKAHSRGGLISCSIRATAEELNRRLASGLVQGHSYSVTSVRKVQLAPRDGGDGSHKQYLLRMRNPWGHREWNGSWSDTSEEWKMVSGSERQRMGITVRNDGEFWMSLTDWCNNFTDAVVCRLVNTALLSVRKTWEEVRSFGEWVPSPDPRRNRAGGCSNYDTYLQNPQYMFQVQKDKDEILISLQQQDRDPSQALTRPRKVSIGFLIYKVEENRRYRLHRAPERVAVSNYINALNVFLRLELACGRYVLIPSTYRPGIPRRFLLRLYSDVASNFRELTKDSPLESCWVVFHRPPVRVVTVHLRAAKVPGKTGISPYGVIICEDVRVKSDVFKGTQEAAFNTRAIFYQRRPDKPIVIQVWSSHWLKDELLGEVGLPELNQAEDEHTLQLETREGGGGGGGGGTIMVHVRCSDDITAL